ncbi:MAG TPA: cell division topological specificity factor MinE [Anaerolineaceae bacterium]|jgi:cell division topological specificity factor|nr:cell division topological specificity factor MinE [Longilinea sp.]HNR47205.1 cell division topological specificity factor MinE [Anaerolineaceae bacterium]HNS38216.1 cell division topological specificity factor MinE [Anaerolineaceae bacterium]HNZ13002.1 cell division topological specificity factor MinE [Anaerolineaceae bacterium]HOD03902.1 cell division topological specificity factor MinE [Anaerolineaceae bacterium]
MSDWLDRLLGRQPKSASSAKERLKLVLINDRTDLTSSELEALKNELLEVIGRYIDIDPAAIRIEMMQEGREQRLLADIPLRASRRHR